MDNNLVIGLVVSALAVLIGLFISLATPLIKLNNTIQRLNDSIDRLEENATKRDKQLEQLNSIIDKHSMWLTIDKKRLDNQAIRLSKIDGETGFVDKEDRK